MTTLDAVQKKKKTNNIIYYKTRIRGGKLYNKKTLANLH